VSVRQLQQGIDMQCSLVASMLKETVDERNIRPILELLPQKSRQTRLREAIEVLEKSRKAFKSKNLGILRKNLIRVLIETN
jgi:hypothetical protein